MKKIFVTMMALVLTIAAQAGKIDSTQFVAFYNYSIQTQNDEGQDVTDSLPAEQARRWRMRLSCTTKMC